jgi:hypothetical protein
MELKPPRKYNTPMVKQTAKKTYEVNGTVGININKTPVILDIQSGRYKVEYYINDELIYETTGKDRNENITFGFNLDTTIYENGIYKLTVNYYDYGDGNSKPESAIEIEEMTINNEEM